MGITFDNEADETNEAAKEVEAQQDIQELVQMHINKMKDEHTTLFVCG